MRFREDDDRDDDGTCLVCQVTHFLLRVEKDPYIKPNE